MVDEHLQHPPGGAGINVFAGNERFEILREIGAVGMAVVLEVTDSQREARIALGWPGESRAWGPAGDTHYESLEVGLTRRSTPGRVRDRAP